MSADTPCQRWNSGRHSWRHLREGGFDRRRYQVTDLAEADAKAFCAAHHYAGASYPAAIRRYGLIDRADGRLVGAAVLGAPVSSKVLTGPLPTLEPYRESVELSRFVLLDECPAMVMLPDGTVLNARAAQKVRSQEQGHQYVEGRLEALGARGRRAEEDPSAWLREAIAAVGAGRVQHPGAYRYVFRLDRPRDRVPLGLAPRNYPKPVHS